MNILITGHKGFIGKNLTYHLQKLGHAVQGYEYQSGIFPDLSDVEQVIHLGAISSTTERDLGKIMKQNFEFSLKLFSMCNSNGVDFQYASSASVYGNTDDFTESSRKNPNSYYSWSKYLFDTVIESVPYNQSNIKVQGFRYFNVYGPDEGHKMDQASPITKFTQQAKDKGVIKIFENSENYKRDFVCVHDVCDVHEKMLSKDVSGIFNVGTGTAVSFREIAELIAEKYQAKIEIVPMPQTLNHQYQTYTCSNNKLLNSHVDKEFITVKDYIQNELK